MDWARYDAAQTAEKLTQTIKKTRHPYALGHLARATVPLVGRPQPPERARASGETIRVLARVVRETRNVPARSFLAPAQSCCVALSAGVAVMGGADCPLLPLALLPTAAESLPCRLSTQQLIELLKLPACTVPACTGAARRVVLDHLGNRYQWTFTDEWDFVRFARKQPGLDLSSPPAAPDKP